MANDTSSKLDTNAHQPTSIDGVDIAEAFDFWNIWLTKSGNYQRKKDDIEECKNINVLYEAAFRGYVQMKNTDHDHWFLNLQCDEHNQIHIGISGKDSLYLQNDTMRKWIDAPVDPKYFLLVLVRKNVMFVFKKLHNFAPYCMITQDFDSVVEFRRLVGDYKCSENVLKDDNNDDNSSTQ